MQVDNTDLNRRAHNLLLGALGALQTYGWGQASLEDQEGLSLLGALSFICSGGTTATLFIPEYLPEYRDLKIKWTAVKALQDVIGEQCLLTWNSAFERTEEEVMEAIVKAAGTLV